MSQRRHEPTRPAPRRRSHQAKRHTVLEFLALTFLVVAVAFTAGMVIRKHQSQGNGMPGLMRVDTPVREALATEPTRRHTLVPAAGPAVVEEPAPAPARIDPVVKPVAAPQPVAPAAQPARPQAPAAQPADERLTFNGRPLRKARTIRMLVTAYSPDERSCGASADGITASGYSVWTNGMKMVAADTRVLPMKTIISVPGYNGGKPVPVLDRGGAIKGNRLDVLYPTHEVAMQWGKQWVDVTVFEYAD